MFGDQLKKKMKESLFLLTIHVHAGVRRRTLVNKDYCVSLFFPVSALIPGDTGFLHELPQENRKLGKSPFRQSWYCPEDCGVTFSHYGFQRTR